MKGQKKEYYAKILIVTLLKRRNTMREEDFRGLDVLKKEIST